MLYLIVRYLIRYRLAVVRGNLRTAFPSYSDEQLKEIEQCFYHHFISLFWESMAMGLITKRQMRRMFRFENVEIAHEMAEQSNTILCVFGHQCNWDLVASVPIWSDDVSFNALYKPLHVKFFDRLFVKIRQRFGTTLIPHHTAARTILRNIREPKAKPQLYAFNTDQSPRIGTPCEWVEFFGRDTAAIPGWAQMAVKYNLPVIYLHLRKTGKWRFTAYAEQIKGKDINELLQKYYDLLQQDITTQPDQYLWSHRRWKLTR